MDLQHVEGEGEEGAEEAGPGCEVEELTSAGQSPPAGGHGDSSTEIQDLEHEMMFLGFKFHTYNTGKSDSPLFRDDIS